MKLVNMNKCLDHFRIQTLALVAYAGDVRRKALLAIVCQVFQSRMVVQIKELNIRFSTDCIALTGHVHMRLTQALLEILVCTSHPYTASPVTCRVLGSS